MNFVASKFRTMPAALERKWVVSNISIAEMPLLPAMQLARNDSAPIPLGLTTPMPVITTRLMQLDRSTGFQPVPSDAHQGTGGNSVLRGWLNVELQHAVPVDLKMLDD